MSQTSYFTSPMARKKRGCHYDPNSYRVISESAENIPSFRQASGGVGSVSLPSNNLIGQPIVQRPRPESEHRHNRPNPVNVNFLRHDVRLLNEPVCKVDTASTSAEQHRWWPHQTSTDKLNVPPHTNDTIVRQDFQYRGSGVQAKGRFGSNTERTAARGVVPVNFLRDPDNKQKFWQEDISYEHQFNSRVDPQYPVRSKRHGAFVWDRIPPQQVEKMLEYHKDILPQQTSTKQLDTAQQERQHVSFKQDSSSNQSIKQESVIQVSPQQQQLSCENTSTMPTVVV